MNSMEDFFRSLLGENEDPLAGMVEVAGASAAGVEVCAPVLGSPKASELLEIESHSDFFGSHEEWTGVQVEGDLGQRETFTEAAGLRQQRVAQPTKGSRRIKWENFATSLGRALKKSIKICEEMNRCGIEKTLKKYKKLHQKRKKWMAVVRLIVEERSEESLLRLFTKYLEISQEANIVQFGKPYFGPCHTDGHSREAQLHRRPPHKTWNYDFQRSLFSSAGSRKYFYFFVQFLDMFGEYGEGVELCKALNIHIDETAQVKHGLLYGYISRLGLTPFDGSSFAPVFLIEKISEDN